MSQAAAHPPPQVVPSAPARRRPRPRQPLSPNTENAYARDWNRFVTWCEHRGHRPLPAEPAVIAAYLREAYAVRDNTGNRAYAPATLTRWAAAIAHHHRVGDHPPPTDTGSVRAALAKIQDPRDCGPGAVPRSSAALLTDDVVAMVSAARLGVTDWASEVLERRDSAILLVGFAGALRRCEVVDLKCGDVTVEPTGRVALRLARASGEGPDTRELAIGRDHHTCSPCALRRWLQVVAAFDAGRRAALIRLIKRSEGFDEHICGGVSAPRVAARSPLFRSIRKNGNLSTSALSGASVHRVIRRRAEVAGLGTDLVDRLGAQSLRAGFVAQALLNGADVATVARRSGLTEASLLAYRRRFVTEDIREPELGL